MKTFGDLRAVDGIDLEVRRGEVFGVLGPNGAGKTTMLQMLATLLPDGRRPAPRSSASTSRSTRTWCASWSASPASTPRSTRTSPPARTSTSSAGCSASTRRSRASTAEELLGRFGLEDAGDKQISQFSGGMRRRLDLAASLIPRPPLIFLDEPTTGLDPRTRGQMWDTIRELVAQGCTVLLTTQYLDEADQLADRIAVIDRGRKVAEGTSDQLKSQVGVLDAAAAAARPRRRPPRPVDVVRRVVGDEPVLTPEAGGINVPLPDANRAADVLIGLREQELLITSATVQKPTLDEVFMALTGHGAEERRPDRDGAGPMTLLFPHGRRDRHRHHPVRHQRTCRSGRPSATPSARASPWPGGPPRRCAATSSARHYADWARVASADPYADRAAFRSDEVPGNGCILYTAAVVTPRGGSRTTSLGCAEAARPDPPGRSRRRGRRSPRLGGARARAGSALRLSGLAHGQAGAPRRAEAAASEAVYDLATRSRGVGDPTELMLVDEVDRLKMSGLEQLRALFDDGGIGLVLIGMPGLERRLARYAQLSSRIGFVHEFRPLGAADVRTLLSGWRPPGVSLPEDLLADAEGVATIIRITGGNFRLLDRLLTQVGRILALNGLGVVTREVVEAAREVLVIGAATAVRRRRPGLLPLVSD